jgi:uncharacterized membrane protein YdjX (TVP38/TMEM64 family)
MIWSILLVLIVYFIFYFSEFIREGVFSMIYWVEAYMIHSPLLGAFFFFLISALSVPMAFFSGLVLIPSALLVWGIGGTFVLLFSGWMFGSLLTYGVGRLFGKSAVHKIAHSKKLNHYANYVHHKMPLWNIALISIVVPEVSGYLLGLMRYSFHRYVLAIILAELPLSLLAVFAGNEFVEQRFVEFVVIVILVMIGVWYVVRRMRHKHIFMK